MMVSYLRSGGGSLAVEACVLTHALLEETVRELVQERRRQGTARTGPRTGQRIQATASDLMSMITGLPLVVKVFMFVVVVMGKPRLGHDADETVLEWGEINLPALDWFALGVFVVHYDREHLQRPPEQMKIGFSPFCVQKDWMVRNAKYTGWARVLHYHHHRHRGSPEKASGPGTLQGRIQ